MTDRPVPERFLVSFSFAGEQRPLVRAVAEEVERRLGIGSVFLDEWFEYYIAGDDADTRLQEIYTEKSEVVVVCVSGNYGGKMWTRAEHEAIRALNMQVRASENPRDDFRVLPLRVGDGDVKGIPLTSIVPDIRGRSPQMTAEMIINRLKLTTPGAIPNGSAQGASLERFVYLAEVTPDLEDASKPISRARLKSFLEDLGWTVLPREEYSADEYQTSLEADLKKSQAFVQLRGPYPWKRGGFDRLQNDTAVTLDTRRFIYRSTEIDLASVEPESHRSFLSAPEVMYTGFDDFLVYLEKELEGIVQALTSSRKREVAADPPLIRVVTHSSTPDALWEQVFQWIYIEEQILSDHLGPDESFEAKQRIEPCQGFLVICDATALDDGPMSPRRDMEQCRLIQIREKDNARRPPVALVYWPPPEPSWSKLLRSVPLKLHYAAADVVARKTPAALGEFFAEVRKVAR
jgi:hypothetical protein